MEKIAMTITAETMDRARIHADANSNGMNMLEIAKEVYGNGASGRVIER